MASAIIQFALFVLVAAAVVYFVYKRMKKDGEVANIQAAAKSVETEVSDTTKKLYGGNDQ